MSHNAKRSTPTTSDSTPAPQKRRRVSRACDACRSAKDKCDGARPRCQRCISLRRRCTYLDPGKRRGIRTGYLRAIELALALLLESLPTCEGVLLRALAEHSASLSEALLDKDSSSPAVEALLGRWQRSEAFKAVGRLISRDEDVREDEALEGDIRSSGWSEETPGQRPEHNDDLAIWRQNPPPHIPSALVPVPAPSLQLDTGPTLLLKLPHDFRRYLDVYTTSTHSWLPIADEEALRHLPASYPITGLRVNFGDRASAVHSELWSAMAVGASLDPPPAGTTDSIVSSLPPHVSLYTTARRLLPLEGGAPTTSHVRSLLLLSLAKLAQDDTNASWLLIGQAVTLLLQIIKDYGDHGRDLQDQHRVLLMGCFVLDTLISLSLGNPPHMRALDLPSFLDIFGHQASEVATPRGVLMSAGRPSHPDIVSDFESTPPPITALFQQYKFARVLSQHLSPRTTSPSPPSASRASDLVESLEPPFHFCNSLIRGSIIRKAPGAVLAETGFLTSSILLSSAAPAPHLIESLVDMVGQYMSHSDPGARPVLLAVYVKLATQDGRLNCLGPDGRARTVALLAALRGQAGSADSGPTPKPSQIKAPNIPPTSLGQLGGSASEQPPTVSHVHENTFSNASLNGHMNTSVPLNTFAMHNPLLPNHNNAIGAIAPSNRVLNAGFDSQNSPLVNSNMPEGYSTDYDAILDELSSMDYVDSNEPDPQFMANLGFAPGCELDDMFGGHFGLV